jgi:uncharacterized protein YbjT (DUF2867 family)
LADLGGRRPPRRGTSATIALTGPRAYSHADVAKHADRVTGKRISIEQLTDAAVVEELVRAGVSGRSRVFRRLSMRILGLGYADVVDDVLATLSGHEPRTLGAFLETSLR